MLNKNRDVTPIGAIAGQWYRSVKWTADDSPLCGQMGAVFLILTCLIFVSGLLASPSAVVAGEDVDGTLYFVWWRASFWGEKDGGTACWLPGDDGALRYEIGRQTGENASADLALTGLLQQQGEGWTLTAVHDLEGTFQPWGERWQEADPRLLQWGRVVSRALVDPDTAGESLGSVVSQQANTGHRPAPRPQWQRRANSPEGQRKHLRLELESTPATIGAAGRARLPATATDFRRQQEWRGRGRGGPGEIVDLRWLPADDPPGKQWVRITSSRRPGRLEITVPVENNVTYPVPETFLPLWPLAELLVDARGLDSSRN